MYRGAVLIHNNSPNGLDGTNTTHYQNSKYYGLEM